MIEFRSHKIELAKKISEMKNIPEVLNNGYNKTPNPFMYFPEIG